MDRKDRPGGDSDKNIAIQIVHKERTVPRIDIGIVAGHHSQQADRVVSFGLLGGQAMDASRSGQSRQGTGLCRLSRRTGPTDPSQRECDHKKQSEEHHPPFQTP